MNTTAWAILGIVAGAIAKLLPWQSGRRHPQHNGFGDYWCILGGSLVTLVTTGTISLATFLGLPGLVMAILGAMIAIFLWGLIDRNAA